MKKGIMLVLSLGLCLTLCACGKSEAVKNVETMIKQVGVVTEKNLEEVYTVVSAYDALTLEDKGQVKNYDALMEQLDAWLVTKVAGNWAEEPQYLHNTNEMYDKVDLTLNADGTAVGNFIEGPWRVENGMVKIHNGKNDHIYYTYYENGELSLGSANYRLIPQEQYRKKLDDMLVRVELTPENIGEYCQVTIYTENEIDDFGVVTGNTRTYAVLDNIKRAEGLLYFESSEDLAIELLIPEHSYRYQFEGRGWQSGVEKACTYTFKGYPFMYHGSLVGYKDVENEYENIHEIEADEIEFGRVVGEIVYLREEYVAEVKKDGSSMSRLIVLKNGEEIYSGVWREGLEY